MGNKPLVSIITPTYNRGYILPQAINSILNQSYQNWELLIVDDRSSDNTREIVKKWAEFDKRIKYLSNNRKKGPSGARNHGILNSKGEYIAFLDSDDQWFPNHLTDCIHVLTNENIDICFASWYEMHSGNLVKFVEIPEVKEWFLHIATTLKARVKENNLYFFGDGFYEAAALEKVFIYHINTLVMHKSVIQKVGLFNEKLFTAEDTDFFLRIFHDYPFCFIGEAHANYNESNDSLYSFIDRYKFNTDEVSNNQAFIKKLTFQGKYKIKMRKVQRRLIINSDKIKDKKIYLEFLDKSIAKKYLLLGFINRKKHKISAMIYYLKSFLFEKDWRKFGYIGGVICPSIMDSIQIDLSDFDIT